MKNPDWDTPPLAAAPPDFENLLAVLRRGKPSRPTLFEFYLNGPLNVRLARSPETSATGLESARHWVRTFTNAGYDYTTIVPEHLDALAFPVGDRGDQDAASYSMNAGSVIHDRASFDSYEWQDPDAGDYSTLADLEPDLPQGMKLIACGPCGVMENAIALAGFENLCFMIKDDETLAFDIFEAIGSRLVRFYEKCLEHGAVGAVIGNDDWGFRSGTMFSPVDMRRFVFPWHREIVAAAHAAGRPAILHSCGNLEEVMDDVIDDMRYDGKHSFEDAIQPVEEAYDQYHRRIAILGGIDVDFVCRETPEAVHDRSKKMLERAASEGSFALGTGNSVPVYVPDENYFAMIRAALDGRQ